MAEAEEAAELSLTDQLKAVEWWEWLIIFILLCLSGSFSGLNLGVLGLDVKDLELMTEGPYETKEDEKEGRYARKLIPLRKRGNLLLCAILLGNVMVNSLLSILMADIAGGGIALVASTALIVIFGEIVPQAICSRHGVKAGAYLSFLLWITICVTFIFAYPIAAILDKVLGEEVGVVMTKSKMKKFFEIQEDMKMIEDEEGRILRATLDLSTRPISEVMVNIEESFMLDINTVINREVTQEIYTRGFSRIPIYEGERSNVCGVLLAKDLILFNPDRDQMTIKQLSSVLREIVYIDHTTTCLRVLSYFKEGGTHLAIVTKVETEDKNDPYLKKIGLITLEDIIEEILDAEIEDEYEGDGKEERRLQKEQLLALFMNRQAGSHLQENELKAVQEFLSSYVSPFFQNRMRTQVLEGLIFNAELLNIESDSRPFTHKTDEHALLESEDAKQPLRVKSVRDREKKQTNLLQNIRINDPEPVAAENAPIKGKIDIEMQQMNGAETGRGLLNGSQEHSDMVANENGIIQEEDVNLIAKDEAPNAQKLFNPILYTRGVESDAFYLILSGKVTVCSGNEGFMIQQTAFNFLGAEALTRDDYKPDFSAKVIDQARILKITRSQYRQAISSIQQTKQGIRSIGGMKQPKVFGVTEQSMKREEALQ